jgi:hypothetical protein
MTGPIGHGKSTFAKAVKQIEPATIRFESSLIIAEVANALHASTRKIPTRDDINSINEWLKPLPAILLETVHQKCSFSQIEIELSDVEKHPVEYDKLLLHIESVNRNPLLLEKEITPENKEAYRPILQWLGGYLVKNVSSDIWYAEIIRRVLAAQAEGYKICIIGGIRFPHDATLVHEAGGIIIKVYRPDHLQYDMLDPTERERDNVRADCTIVSNGTVEDMSACARQVMDDIRNHSLQHVYQSVKFAQT